MEASKINDYPIRNMLVSLEVRCRRWEVTIDGKKNESQPQLGFDSTGYTDE